MSSFLAGIGSFLGGAARLIPGYMNGYRTAVADNWSDMKNYIDTQKGQISNLFDISTFYPDVVRANALASNAQMGTVQNAMALAQSMAGFPGQMDYYNAWSDFAPYTAPLYFGNQFLQSQRLYNEYLNGNPAAMRMPSSIGVG